MPVQSLHSLSVWVSEPQSADLGEERKFEFNGCFLYPVEGRYDNQGFITARSGCSALQAVVNLATGREMVSGCAEGRGGQSGEKLTLTLSTNCVISVLEREGQADHCVIQKAIHER